MTILTILFSFIFGFIGAYCMSKIGHRFSLVDNVNERSSHSTPTPRGGGIGILAALLFAGVFVLRDIRFTFIFFGVGICGFLDDIFSLSPKLRLLFQILFSATLVFMRLGAPGSSAEVLIFSFLVIFITGTANFYNFMDGINGIAAITGIVGFGLVAYFAYFISKTPSLALTGVILSTACLGFLPFNFLKAKVFMGDVGSVSLGFVFALMAVWLSRNVFDFICLSSFLFPFYADELTMIYIRLRSRENLMLPHRRHFYQILANELQVPHWKVSSAYGITQFAIGVSVLFLRPLGILPVLSALVLYFVVAVAVTHAIRDGLEFNCKKI
jgi:Fuc2NAc and GlcNAc transferase